MNLSNSNDLTPDAEPNDNSMYPHYSLEVTLNDGTKKNFPAIKDYISKYIADGIVRNKEDLIHNYNHLIWEIFFHQISTGQNACFFATKLARKPRKARWIPFVELDALTIPDLPGVLNTRLDAASKQHEAVQFIFPDIETPNEIANLINNLCKNDRWYWTKIDWKADTGPEKACLIGLRWILPNKKSVNYTLGFANINTMPLTRRGPFTSLVLRVQDKKRNPPKEFDTGVTKIENGLVAVHLADMDSLLRDKVTNLKYWEKTKEKKKLMVETDLDSTARAKVTFSLPLELEKILDSPTEVEIIEIKP